MVMNNKNKLILTGLCLFTLNSFAASSCPQASSVTSAEFCSSFKTAAECHCISSGLPRKMCNNYKLLYKRMMDTFGSLQRACEYQHDTSVQECIDDWNCFLSGGSTSNSGTCSGTGLPCA